MESQDSTPLRSQALQEIITPDQSLAAKENFVLNELTSSLMPETQEIDTATLSKETTQTNQTARKQSIQTGIPNEFVDEVRILKHLQYKVKSTVFPIFLTLYIFV